MSDIEPRQRHPLHSTAQILEAALKDLGAVRGKSAKLAKTTPRVPLRPIIVYGLSDTKAACQAVLEQGRQDLAIMSPTGVAHSLGPQWFKGLLSNTAAMFSELKITGILDCGPYEGHVMNAIHSGIKDVYYSGESEAAEKLDWIAAKASATIHRSFAEILDLKGESDPMAACRQWFGFVPPDTKRRTARV